MQFLLCEEIKLEKQPLLCLEKVTKQNGHQLTVPSLSLSLSKKGEKVIPDIRFLWLNRLAEKFQLLYKEKKVQSYYKFL